MSHMIQLDCRNPIFGNGKTKVTYGYMDPQYGSPHYGADLVPGTGTEEAVTAIEDGEIIYTKCDVNRTLSLSVQANWSSPDALGNHVVIRHPNGYISKYCHLKYGTVRVKAGDKVKKGTKLGIIGNTGLSTAPHVHFEIWTKENDRSSRVDPEPFIMGTKSLKGTGSSAASKPVSPSTTKSSSAYNSKSRTLAFEAVLRKQPSSTSPAVCKLKPGNTVTVISGKEHRESASGYVYLNVSANNKSGWIVKTALK